MKNSPLSLLSSLPSRFLINWPERKQFIRNSLSQCVCSLFYPQMRKHTEHLTLGADEIQDWGRRIWCRKHTAIGSHGETARGLQWRVEHSALFPIRRAESIFVSRRKEEVDGRGRYWIEEDPTSSAGKVRKELSMRVIIVRRVLPNRARTLKIRYKDTVGLGFERKAGEINYVNHELDVAPSGTLTVWAINWQRFLNFLILHIDK